MRSILLSAVFIAVAVVRFYRNTACVKFIRVFFICAVKVFIDKNLTGNDARLELYLNAGQGVVTLIQRIAHGIGGHAAGSEVDLTAHQIRVPFKHRLQTHVDFQFGILRDRSSVRLRRNADHFDCFPLRSLFFIGGTPS